MSSSHKDLAAYRKELDEIDEELMGLMARRFEVCRAVGAFKAKHGIPMMQPERVAQVKERAGEWGMSAGLNRQFGIDLYDLIVKEACRLEEEIMNHDQAEGLK